jgi:hypothetical protein
MKRLCFALGLWVLAGGPAFAVDVDVYLPGDKSIDRARLIKEDVQGMTVKPGGEAEVQIPAEQIRQVTYRLDAVAVLEFRKPFSTEDKAMKARGAERVKLLELARTEFDALAGVAEKESREAHRYLRFKGAEVLTRLAGEEPSRRDEAIKALREFTRTYPDGWQVVPALKLQAGLLEAKGDIAGASTTYEELAKLPGIPDEVKQHSQVLVAQLYIRSEQFPRAEAKLAGLYKNLSAADGQRPLVAVYLAQSQLAQGKLGAVEKYLREALHDSADGKLRALAHNFLGDYYRQRKEGEKAFWEYLKVDMLYADDPEQHAKAIFHLGTLFDTVKNNPVRAKQYQEKLKDARFAETRYGKRAAADK